MASGAVATNEKIQLGNFGFFIVVLPFNGCIVTS
jgi:hypothetical protein